MFDYKTRFYTTNKSHERALGKIDSPKLQNSDLKNENKSRTDENNAIAKQLYEKIKMLDANLVNFNKVKCKVGDLQLEKQHLRNNVKGYRESKFI